MKRNTTSGRPAVKGLVILMVATLCLTSGAWSKAVESSCDLTAGAIVAGASSLKPTAVLSYTPANQCGGGGAIVESYYVGSPAVAQYARWENGDEFASMGNAHAMLCADGRARVWVTPSFREVCNTLSADSSPAVWTREELIALH